MMTLSERTVRAVLFDMDGVITDTEQSVVDFWLQLAAEKAVTLSAADFEAHVFGVPANHTLQALFPPLDATELAVLHERMEAYELGLQYVEVPGAGDFLRTLKAWGVPTALVTSGQDWKADAVCDQLGLVGLFTTRVTATHIRRGKPAPDCYLAAARQLGLAPEACLVFEDALTGAQAALTAGMVCVGVQKPERAAGLYALGVSAVVPDLRSLRVSGGLLCLDGQGEMRLQTR